jgi:hypothetical protein
MRPFTLITTRALTSAEALDFAALQSRPDGSARNERIKDLMLTIGNSGATALMTVRSRDGLIVHIKPGVADIPLASFSSGRNTDETVEDVLSNDPELLAIAQSVIADGTVANVGPGPIYLMHFNYDFEESMETAFSMLEVHQTLFDELRMGANDMSLLSEADVEAGSALFWDEVRTAYNDGRWKGLTVHAFDPQTNVLSPYFF